MDRKTFLKEGPRIFLRAFLRGVQEDRREEPRLSRDSLPLLRPPGAAPEEEFLETCCGVGACAMACPASAIQLRPRGQDTGRMMPVIVPGEAACIVCDELACMNACTSGALTPLPREEIRIGYAFVDPGACLTWMGIDLGCNYCADRCPFGADAITLGKKDGRRGPVVKEGCVGCGVCEFYCPAQPAAIRVLALV